MLEQLGPQIQASMKSVVNLAAQLAFVVAIFVPMERLFPLQPNRILRKGIWTDLCYYLLNGLTTTVFLSVPFAVLAWSIHQTIPDSFHTWSTSLPFWARVALGFVAGEIGYYWGHRLCHEIPFLWRFHAIHHSAEHVDFLVNTRAHPVDMVFGRFCGLAPIFVLGLNGPADASRSQVPEIVTLIALLWGYFIHANLRWRFGPLEWLISTPAFHHWHHTLTPINRNYASTLPWLDRIFGTHYLPRNEMPKVYGIKATMPESILDQLAYPLDPPALATATTGQNEVESQKVVSVSNELAIPMHEGVTRDANGIKHG